MLINGVDLSVLGIQLYDRILQSNSVDTSQEWLEGDIQPTFIRQQDKFKNIQLKFLVLKDNEAEAFLVMSKLTSMLKKASIIFDDIDLVFDVTMRGPASQSRLKNGNFIQTFNLRSDYAKGATEVYTTDSVATDYFKLKLLYYREGNVLLSSEDTLIKASDFKTGVTFETLGINLNKYQPDYFQGGAVSNFNNKELTYANLKDTGTLIINYSPIVYQKEIEFYKQDDDGDSYSLVETGYVHFTKDQIDAADSLGDIIDLSANKPNGYRVLTDFNSDTHMDFTFENIMNYISILRVKYERITNEKSKEITVSYYTENTAGGYDLINAANYVIREGDIVPGSKITNFIRLNLYKPEKYYADGALDGFDENTNLDFNTLPTEFTVRYALVENSIYVEYYYGTYPTWNRITTFTYNIKYNPAYDDADNIFRAVGIDIDKYAAATYEAGRLFNVTDTISTFDDLVSVGILQVYYEPKQYDLVVKYYQDNLILETDTIQINETMFFNAPVLAQIINLNKYRPEGYTFDEEHSYSGLVTLGNLLANAPIEVHYKEVDEIRTKSIVIKYKQEFASAFSTINTSIITIEESQVGGGVTLPELFNLNAYKPEYYDDGILDGVSAATVFTFEELQGTYNVLYLAAEYSTPVRYYTDEIANENWVGSDSLKYKIISFTVDTTLFDLGLNLNGFKPSYCGDGEIQYTGPVNFAALRELESIDVLYMSNAEPIDPSGIDYPHRILFLQHNDMGDFESLYPTWTLNHAYINTGVTCDDVSKLSVLVDTYRVFETEPLYNVNVQDAYLFGAVSPSSSYYIKYRNNTKFRLEEELTGVNLFKVAAGRGTPELIVEETSSEGFSSNTGISSSTRDGYSYGTITFTHLVQSNVARMDVPLYLFACDYNGYYRGGIAGVGIKSCKIYYDGTLIRDFVPVAFFDKIGDKIAPSNCLYDKVTQTFFEDARGLNSFNIMDDPDVTDTNPEHNLGCCYANYYKDGVLFNAATIWFRESDFVNGNEWVPVDKLFVDYYQPKYCGAGVITNLADLGGVSFNNVKNFIFRIDYEVSEYSITVNYYKDEATEGNLLASDEIILTEKDFYQVPTFGQIVPIQKYKPDYYKANYTYGDTKVTLQRILDHSPYTIVYTEVENPQTYTTTVKYLRKRFGISPLTPLDDYDTITTETITLDETQFADGVFIDGFIDLNKHKPQSGIENVEFYQDGEPYGWYLEDDMLDTPDKLHEEYLVIYDPDVCSIEIRYYTDEVDEDNLIATDIWMVTIDMWHDGEQFQIVDELPNNYVNRYKPVICWGGELDKPSEWYTFNSLVETGHIDIVYETKEEPHDPDNTDWPSKILWFQTAEGGINGGAESGMADWCHLDAPHHTPNGLQQISPRVNITTPYINLGYTPKEIGRLKTEVKAYALNSGIKSSRVSRYSLKGNDYAGFFGYCDSADLISSRQFIGKENVRDLYFNATRGAAGNFVYEGHTPSGGLDAGGEINDFQTLDGHTWHSHSSSYSASGIYAEGDVESVREMSGQFRRGTNYIYNEELENIQIYKNYSREVNDGWGKYINGSPWNPSRSDIESPAVRVKYVEDGPFDKKAVEEYKYRFVAGNPVTITLDAPHNYTEAYDYTNYLHPLFDNLEDKDHDVWKERTKPKAPITFGITTNPRTGKINWKASDFLGIITGMGAGRNTHIDMLEAQNPYSEGFSNAYTVEATLVVGEDDDGNPIYEQSTKTVSIAWSGMEVDTFPVPARVALWHIKMWDQDRLVRDLIPVKAGEQIYDFIAPANGLFDRVTEIFFGNSNEGGTYDVVDGDARTIRTAPVTQRTVTADQVAPFHVCDDWTIWGKVVVNYYDDKNNFLGNQYVTVPLYSREANETVYDILRVNDFKPSEFYHDGEFDVDFDFEGFEYQMYNPQTHLLRSNVMYGEWSTGPDDVASTYLKKVFDAGVANIYYKLLTFTKTVEYYQGNTRVGSKDIFYNIDDINAAESLEDLGVDTTLYASDDYKPGRIVFNEQILRDHDIKAFIDAPSPVVIYDEYTAEEKPDLLYVNWYRGGAYDDNLITLSEDPNYLNCELDARVLNPRGAIKYLNHYHTALYEDEKQDYFIAYQVDVDVNYLAVHKGPGRIYNTLAEIVDKGRYTIVEEKRGWGRLREYPKGWILLAYTHPVVGPGRNPAYDQNQLAHVTIPYAEMITITKMTIDRLWCYCPEYASWVKAQDISFDQSGKLYNAIARKVIHLDEVDWNTVSTWGGLGVTPDQYRMRFHDVATVNYDGEINYAGLSAAHQIDIVNPETIYAYNVTYHKDTFITDETAAGRATANTAITVYEDIDKTTVARTYSAGDSFLFYGSNAINPDILETEHGYIDIENNYTVTRPSALSLDYPLVQNVTNEPLYLYTRGTTRMGRVYPHQVVPILRKVIPQSATYEEYATHGVYNFGSSMDDMRTAEHLEQDGSVTDINGTVGAANSFLPSGLEIIHTGSIISTGSYYGLAFALNDISVYNDNNEVVDTIPIGTKFTILDFENNKYQVDGGWINKKNVKITDFGPFKVSTQRSFRNQEIGRASFSCSISDWNPDWPTFIKTSWQYGMITTPGKATANATMNMYSAPYVSSGSVATFAANTLFTLLNGPRTVNGIDWYEATANSRTGWIKLSEITVTRDVSIVPDYTKPINPTLYKDTPITLTWDFFGMDKNLYKPEGDYDDGLFLWNPRSYENKDVYFTFEELITTGTQTVLYLPKYKRYKATFPYGSYVKGATINIHDFCIAPKAESHGIWDYEIKSNWITNVSFKGLGSNANSGARSANLTVSLPLSDDNYYIVNVSNKREATTVFSYGNDLNGYYSDHYGVSQTPYVDSLGWTQSTPGLVKMTKTTNPITEKLYWFGRNDEVCKSGNYGTYTEPYTGYEYSKERYLHTTIDTPAVRVEWSYTVNPLNPRWVTGAQYYDGPVGLNVNDNKRTLYHLKVWKNYFLEKYIIPLPQGYVINNRKLKANCLMDVLSGELYFPDVFKGIDDKGKVVYTTLRPPIITPIGTRVDYNSVSSSIDDALVFDKTDINKFIVVERLTKSFKQPADTATELDSFTTGFVLPVFYKTEDVEHGIEGLWYSDSKGWLQGYSVSLVADGTLPKELIKQNFDIALKGTVHNTVANIKKYTQPAIYTSNRQIQTEQVVHVYAKYDNRYWIGTGWINIEDTSSNISSYEEEKHYVIAQPLVPVYSQPVANDAYKLVTVQRGDRINVDNYLTKDEAWKYAKGLGWIDTTDAISEII